MTGDSGLSVRWEVSGGGATATQKYDCAIWDGAGAWRMLLRYLVEGFRFI